MGRYMFSTDRITHKSRHSLRAQPQAVCRSHPTRIAAMAIFVFGAAFAASCRRTESQPQDAESRASRQMRFDDVTDDVGIDFRHRTGLHYTFFYPEIMGAGVAVFDYNGDGLTDIYFINGGQHSESPSNLPIATNRLFRATSNGRFIDATQSTGLGDDGYGMGCAVGDIDNDGDVDVLVTNYGPNAQYRNEGQGRFQNITASAGLLDSSWSMSACMLDFDRDGLLDIYIANYLDYDPTVRCADATGDPDYCGPQKFAGSPDRLYRNIGNAQFDDVSRHSGIASTPRRGLGVICADIDGDGWTDVYVANDGQPNTLWINQRNGSFRDEAPTRGAAVNADGRPEASMGLATADINRDGWTDIFATHLSRESNTLYASVGRGAFQDRTVPSGLAADGINLTGFGTVIADFDLDGDLDIAVTNGRVFSDTPLEHAVQDPYWRFYAEPNLLYLNDGAGRFTLDGPYGGDFAKQIDVGRALVPVDLDRDGDLDIVSTQCGGRARVYRNHLHPKLNWFTVRAFDPGLNRDAYNAIVTISTNDNQQRREIMSTTGYLSAVSPRAHFGIGIQKRVDRVTVNWLGGPIEQFGPFLANQSVALFRGTGRTAQTSQSP
jgi:enediyne biosynthesis protein E4